MRDPRARLIVPALPEPGTTVRVPRPESAHARARRLAPGDPVALLDGSGREGHGTVLRFEEGVAVVEVVRQVAATDAGPAVTVFAAALRPARLAWLVEKATEMGVSRVVVLRSARTQPFRASSAALERLESVARAAAKQCGRADWPSVSGPIELDGALADSSPHRLFLDLDGAPFPRRLTRESSAIFVGPEGGWTEEERRTAGERGWSVVRLPGSTLRGETAAVAALALLAAARAPESGNDPG